MPYSHQRLILSTGWQCYYIKNDVPQQSERGLRMANALIHHNELGPAIYDKRTHKLTFYLDGGQLEFKDWVKYVKLDPEYEVMLRLQYL